MKHAIIGLGKLGLPMAVTFSDINEVTGFDQNIKIIQDLNNHICPIKENQIGLLKDKMILDCWGKNENIKERTKYYRIGRKW
jgi:UDP-N-acetyl-D-mannosaminuronate dehydrogenase